MADLVNHPDFLVSLRALGLSQYEAQVYLALLGEGATEVATVIRKAEIPQNKAYEALASLQKKGFRRRHAGRGVAQGRCSRAAVVGDRPDRRDQQLRAWLAPFRGVDRLL